MIPRAYPQIPLRAKFAIAPYVLLLVVLLGFLDDQGVIDLSPSPTVTTTAQPATMGVAPGRAARADIPPRYLALYQRGARACPGLGWGVLAAVGKVESDHGRVRLPGVRSGWNAAGAAGPMQFGIGKGAAGNAWARFGRGGNVYDPRDAIPAAARYLCAHGAPTQLRRALYAYNHSHTYVRRVLDLARRYQPPARGGAR